ncbi:DUF1488 family protein [Gallaecimonas xiamenensis]|uniref:Uncharacterized protein n=1 Tax=Gallaecimonas xiamenensis 3-C-1 TaxID=745411 RepID=K2IZT6_9GAMM|nr:DUF1488 family protein [Gallaecimonas xiamenensis]EKE68062.1 hypothetical protein B3C1_17682 [Gallaecimonas xiamenensis 3-C-1]
MNQSLQFLDAAVFDEASGSIRLDATFNGWRIPCYFHASWFDESQLLAAQADDLINREQLRMEDVIEEALAAEALDVQGELHFD